MRRETPASARTSQFVESFCGSLAFASGFEGFGREFIELLLRFRESAVPFFLAAEVFEQLLGELVLGRPGEA